MSRGVHLEGPLCIVLLQNIIGSEYKIIYCGYLSTQVRLQILLLNLKVNQSFYRQHDYQAMLSRARNVFHFKVQFMSHEISTSFSVGSIYYCSLCNIALYVSNFIQLRHSLICVTSMLYKAWKDLVLAIAPHRSL